MSSSTHLPLLFTLPPSSRHDFLLLDTSAKISLKALNKQITSTIASSPNCTEFMAKHKAKDGPAEQIQEFKIHWDVKGREKLWPEYTVLTEDNISAVVELLKGNPGMGVLEVKLGKDE
ncbi:hypothetical protein GGP41_008143 [Bipolaris sorokiniana]|uniref:Uncharacterized protein n=2 Tax=Cochliobolus sativus TaxID=45130 RepID=A0A8H6DYK6_COCSA|nr:uncharacterized protein COCSADRAFT_198141 [Bipolaris sorokiniana ND90Pr]EMD66751.1 hypothetical protein COCSADRAFT_198141 [Bipolaris sorokiniana ND90Pr]KAF5852719.1 hypothetical protein GGP41_008143 [Bipolaris sorokiniana]